MVDAFQQRSTEQEPTGAECGQAFRIGGDDIDGLRSKRSANDAGAFVCFVLLERILPDREAKKTRSLLLLARFPEVQQEGRSTMNIDIRRRICGSGSPRARHAPFSKPVSQINSSGSSLCAINMRASMTSISRQSAGRVAATAVKNVSHTCVHNFV
jgi:hypothetical protein